MHSKAQAISSHPYYFYIYLFIFVLVSDESYIPKQIQRDDLNEFYRIGSFLIQSSPGSSGTREVTITFTDGMHASNRENDEQEDFDYALRLQQRFDQEDDEVGGNK